MTAPTGTNTDQAEHVLGRERAAQFRAMANDDPPLTECQLDALQRLFATATTPVGRDNAA